MSATTTKGKLKIHTENILPILKRWLYSDREIFVRELVANSCDALTKLKILASEGAANLSEGPELRIDLIVDDKARTLTVRDTGLGMTAEEVETYIAQLAFSGAEEFAKRCKSGSEEAIIGHFGLGFYSAYMVAKLVELRSLSYKEGAEGVYWSCDGGADYEIRPEEGLTRGTEVVLHIDEESRDYLEASTLRTILRRYCRFLPFPIYLNGDQINAEEPLFAKAASECTDEEYLKFYRSLYPLEPDPVFWLHLNVDYPFQMRGILYFPQVTKKLDWTRSELQLFCNRVFVSDQCKELLPDYLGVLRGAIDSSDIPLNVSRSTLQMDPTVRQLSSHISKKVCDRLQSLFLNERERFLTAWTQIEWLVKLGCLQDEKFFERARQFLVWKNSEGGWLTIDEAAEKAKARSVAQESLFYSSGEENQKHLIELYKERGIEVLISSNPIDSPLFSFLEGKLRPIKFARVDGALDDALLDKDKENTLLDAEGKTESVRLEEFARSCLPNLKIEAKALGCSGGSSQLSALWMVEEQERRMAEMMALTQREGAAFEPEKSLVLNTLSPLVRKAFALRESNLPLATQLLKQIYQLALLQAGALPPDEAQQLARGTEALLQQLL